MTRAGRDALALAADAVDGWAATAPAGAEIVYATGALPQWATGPARMRALAASGVVILYQRRIDGAMRYCARRTARPLTRGAPPPAPRPAPSIATKETARLMALLRRLAKARAPCPTNSELARLARLTNGDRASYRLKRLRDDGLIRVQETPLGRMVTIAATGATTVPILSSPAMRAMRGCGR